jgi:hypothetical protein
LYQNNELFTTAEGNTVIVNNVPPELFTSVYFLISVGIGIKFSGIPRDPQRQVSLEFRGNPFTKSVEPDAKVLRDTSPGIPDRSHTLAKMSMQQAHKGSSIVQPCTWNFQF